MSSAVEKTAYVGMNLAFKDTSRRSHCKYTLFFLIIEMAVLNI